MDFEQVINSMTPDIYQRLVTAVELGKWPDGVALTAEQKENIAIRHGTDRVNQGFPLVMHSLSTGLPTDRK